MKRAPRGLDTPAGTVGQELAAIKVFKGFLESTGLSSDALDTMHSSLLRTKKSGKARTADRFLAKSTALGYFSQIVNQLRQRYSDSLSDSKRVAKIRDKMTSAIDERNLRANIQTNDAPGCTLKDLCVVVEHLVVHADVATGLKSVHDAPLLTMMWHTFGRAIDTCFARKQQLTLAASGNDVEVETQPAAKRERKRPNIASYVTEVIRDCVKVMPPGIQQSVTPSMTSHSLRRGAAAYANASPKLAIQWISTRGAWLLESLTKAFAYIGTTSREDQCVGKALAGYEAPDLPVCAPTVGDLKQRLTTAEIGQLLTLRDQLYEHVLGSPDPRLNVDVDVVNATFAALLMHMKTVLEATVNSAATPAHVSRYLYELERGISATNTLLGCNISISTCCEWGSHLADRWRTMNHAQLSSAVTGGDSLLASTLENMLAQLTTISDRLARVEDAMSALAGRGTGREGALDVVEPVPAAVITPSVAAAPATASTLAGCFLNWYTNHIWETVQGKKEQNKRADAKAAVNIMKVLYQAPCEIPVQPNRSDKDAHEAWKHNLWTLAVSMDKNANERLHAFDGKKPTSKASLLRKRWRALRSPHSAAFQACGAQYLSLQSSGSIVDACAPASHQWTANDLAQYPQHSAQP